MAKNDLDINLKTKYSGEGIQKLDSSIKNSSAKIRNLSSGFKNAANASRAFGSEAASQLSQVSNSVGQVASGLASGGILGVAIAGAGLLVTKITDKFKELKDAAQEYGKKIKDMIKSSMLEAVHASGEALDSLKGKLASFMSFNSSDINSYKAGNELLRFRENEKIKREMEKKLSTTSDEVARADITAKAKRDTEINNAHYDRKNADLEVEKLDNERVAILRTIDKQQKLLKEAQEQYNTAEENLERALKKRSSDKQFGQVDYNAAKEVREEAKKAWEAQDKALKEAREKLALTERNIRTAEINKTLAHEKEQARKRQAQADYLASVIEADQKAKAKKLKDAEDKKQREAEAKIKRDKEIEENKKRIDEEAKRNKEKYIKDEEEARKKQIKTLEESIKKLKNGSSTNSNSNSNSNSNTSTVYDNGNLTSHSEWQRKKRNEEKAKQRQEEKNKRQLETARERFRALSERIVAPDGKHFRRLTSDRDKAEFNSLREYINEATRPERESAELQVLKKQLEELQKLNNDGNITI